MTRVADRIRTLSGYDRFLLLLVAACSFLGFVDNYFRVHSIAYRMWEMRMSLAALVWAFTAGVVIYSVIRRRRTIADYGFTFRLGGLGSLAGIACLHVYLAVRGDLVPEAPEGPLWAPLAVGAFTQAILFTAIAIDEFIAMMDGVRGKAFWAILSSSALFTIVQIPSKSPFELLGLFLSLLILGYVFYKSRSILLPAWMFAAAGAGFAGGVLAAVVYCAVTATELVTRSRGKDAPITA